MKGVIIAAGRGKRLGPFTADKPKSLVEIGGRSILSRMVDNMRACGIDEICIIRGYRAEMINIPGATYRENTDWENNNILLSLSYAHDFLDSDVVITYSDLLTRKDSFAQVVEQEMNAPFLLQVDVAYSQYYEGRTEHPIEEAESVIYDKDTLRILEVGKKIPHKEDTMGEFTGIWRMSAEGCRIWKDAFEQARALYSGKPFGYAPVFEKAYLTDLMMKLISDGIEFRAAVGTRQVMEVDTVEDLRRAALFLQSFERSQKR